MTTLPERRERIIGWILAGLALLHLLIFQPRPLVGFPVFAVLVAGAILRGRRSHAPRWLAATWLFLSIAGISLTQAAPDAATVYPVLLGELAVATAAGLLLQPLSPARCQGVLYLILVTLVATVLISTTGVGQALIVLDVAAMYVMLEESFRPPEAVIGFWKSLLRSLRVVVPVGIVVLALFWIFPNLTSSGSATFTGYTGSTTLDASSIAELSRSYRVAMTACFAREQPVPPPSDLYWRGQVFEENDSFHWAVAGDRVAHDRRPLADVPNSGAGHTIYTQQIADNRGVLATLDHAISIKATSGGRTIAVVALGAGTFSSGMGPLELAVVSATEPLSKPPDVTIQDGYRQVPSGFLESASIRDIAHRIFSGPSDTPEKLHALSRYFAKSGFRYTTSPGPINDMTKFLTEQRAGFCGHYAAAAANLLRLAGVPTRVVSGYRGGEWNPWLRTITVRDADAHAWVEAWDAAGARWLRFDPTDSVAPEIRAGIAREMNSDSWAWYRRTWSYGTFLATETSTAIKGAWKSLASAELWDYGPLALFLVLAGVATGWIVGRLRSRTAKTPQDQIARHFLDLEQYAAHGHFERRAGETPLGWLERLARDASRPEEKETLRKIASSYETATYTAEPANAGCPGQFHRAIRRLITLWKRPPASQN